jgi:hypothetical protein
MYALAYDLANAEATGNTGEIRFMVAAPRNASAAFESERRTLNALFSTLSPTEVALMVRLCKKHNLRYTIYLRCALFPFHTNPSRACNAHHLV